jgi:TfoX/Sxy family transcriptional regulator of competence genes
MPFDEKLADRARHALAGRRELSEKRMFGGVAFLWRGHMVAGVVGDDLMVRVGPEACDELLKRTHARAMDFTGRPMRGFLFIAPAGTKTRASLERWIAPALAYAASLPRKVAARKTKAASKKKRSVAARKTTSRNRS